MATETTNLSKINRNKMLATIQEIKEQAGDNVEMINNLSAIENELTKKKYGLIWEEHEERVDVELKTKIPVFDEVKELEITNNADEKYNFLLEGDNLHSLYLLEKTHKGRIDVIYIDPPYNRGKNDFIYNDMYINSDDEFKHSKWLSFMNRRLNSAKKLLHKDGVVFIHIDDNEQAQLKILCDDVFGEENFIATIIQNKLNAKNDTINVQKNHEYVHIYRKQTNYIKTKIKPSLIKKSYISKEVFEEEGEYYYINDSITTRGEGGILNARPNLGYTVYYEPIKKDMIAICDYDIELAKNSNDEEKIYKINSEMIEKGYIAIRPPKVRGKLGCWTWALDKFNNEKKNIIITGKNGNYAVKKRTFVDSEFVISENGKFFYKKHQEENSKSIIEFSTNDGTTELTNVMNEAGTFNNPKNVSMIKYLLSLFPNQKARVLDFFAGSGTTGHAVMELNSEDKGSRKFILCTNDENNICKEVTYQRIKNVIQGYKGKEPILANLKYLKTDYIPRLDNDKENLEENLLKNIRSLIELENAINIDDKKIRVFFNEENIDSLVSEKNELEITEKIYISSNILLSAENEKLLDEHNIKVYTIPEYYFKNEIMEVEEQW